MLRAGYIFELLKGALCYVVTLRFLQLRSLKRNLLVASILLILWLLQMLVAAFLCAIFASTSAQTFATGDNKTVEGCSSHCSVLDDNLKCWNKTLHFFEKMVVSQLRHYVAVQTNIYRWYIKNVDGYKANFAEWQREAVKAFEAELTADDILTNDTVFVVAKGLIARVEASKDSTDRPPLFSCPLPCEYRSHLWRYLFIASCVLNALLAIAVIPFIVKMIRSDRDEPLIR